MQSKDSRQRRISPNLTKTKRTKRLTTIEDVLTRDDVNGILADLYKVKPNISDLIVIYMDSKDERYHFITTDNTLVSTATWLLESVKLDLLNSEE